MKFSQTSDGSANHQIVICDEKIVAIRAERIGGRAQGDHVLRDFRECNKSRQTIFGRIFSFIRVLAIALM